MKLIDIFAGAGGFGLGFKLADFTIKYALELDNWAALTYKFNNPEVTVIESDIRDFKSIDEIYSIINDISYDVIIGGPPCQGFSIAGPKKDPKDPRNSLFIDFARWVEFIRPKIFVMENVKGILSRHNSKGENVIDIIKNTFQNIGYHTEIWKLNAVQYGVPQFRERVFIVGNIYGEFLNEPPKTHFDNTEHLDLYKKFITVEEAIGDLPVLSAGEGGEEMEYLSSPYSQFQEWARGEQNILYNHRSMNHTKRIVSRFENINWGESASAVTEMHPVKKRNGNGENSNTDYHMNNRRLHPNKPSYTIPAYFYSSFIHPYQNRNITAREAARLQSFPDFYKFLGKRTVISSKLLQRKNRHEDNHLSQYNQIGNAVPPLLAREIALHIKNFLINKNE